MKLAGRLILAACAACLVSCGGTETREETWEVAANEDVCYGISAQMCLLVRRTPNGPWGNQFGIDGFRHEWGSVYSVRVEIETLDSAPVDGGSERISLKSVLSKTPVPPSTTFEMMFSNAGRELERSSASTFTILRGMKLGCQPEDCAAIDGLIEQEWSARMLFDHSNSPGGPLKLLRIECAAPAANFDALCR